MPDHPFEQLGEQRFQEFCQALLTDTFPRLQCIPVAQPDGGRDALQRVKNKDATIFQVKFARKPDSLKNPEKWVKDLVDAELPKIRRLAQRGASEYKLITNLSATAHLEVGSLDRVQRILKRLIPIPVECWWRADLNRRLEKTFDLKLAYPELFTGNDFIRLLVERRTSDHEAQRRQRAIKAYLADQYEREREVRFRQADLSNDLLGVFIDVPAAPDVSEPLAWNTKEAQVVEAISHVRSKWPRTRRFDELQDPMGSAAAGAGSLLLDSRFQEAAPCVIIEGAPGQGKSTMLQYVCQVHRLKLLDKQELAYLPDRHAVSPVRLPLKVDLRDLAQWLADPVRLVGEEVPQHLRSLEGFLAAQIRAASGGASFDVADLHAAIADSKLLLALDGLDEVVDISDRSTVIDAIVAGVRRLAPDSASLQVVVTSRPASFVGAGSLPPELFQQLRLQSISRTLIDDYAEKWMAARKLDTREGEELKETLDAKLKLPHIRDLAHNPMQLAILLNLIHRRGRALPDQRTALYSSYMEIFLDREADKSESVRSHRKLLLTLHGHLAWLLHCQSETSGKGGRFSTQEIEAIVEEFLVHKGHKPDLFGNLFGGLFDRVGALVSRVQDTYEFEVQPLREYFVARYLYQTAPHSTAGRTRTGARPERFDAMARHPYWLNVTRFYAGSYDIGELASLADHIRQLRRDPMWGSTSHPRMVSAQLLADWTFQQEMGVQDQVVAPLVKDLKTRGTISEQHDPYLSPHSSTTVPSECGGEELLQEAIRLLKKEKGWDRRAALSAVINSQVPNVEERRNLWLRELTDLNGPERDSWIRSSYQLRLTTALTVEDLSNLGRLSPSTVHAILYAEQFEFLDGNAPRTAQAIDAILESPESGEVGIDATRHPLPALSEVLRLDMIMDRPRGMEGLGQVAGDADADTRKGYSAVYGLLTFAHALLDHQDSQFKSSLRPWNLIIEEGRRLFGERRAFTDLAVVAAGVSDGKERGKGHSDLFDPQLSLCRRARHARLRSGDATWWTNALDSADGDEKRILALSLCCTWASDATLKEILPSIIRVQKELDREETSRLLSVLNRARAFSPAKPGRISEIGWFAGTEGAILFACLAGRLSDATATRAVEEFQLFSRDITCRSVLGRIWSYQLRILEAHPELWDQCLGVIAHQYKTCEWIPTLSHRLDGVDQKDSGMSVDVARKVIKGAQRFPVQLVARAEAICMSQAQSELRGVGEIADRDGWFKEAMAGP